MNKKLLLCAICISAHIFSISAQEKDSIDVFNASIGSASQIKYFDRGGVGTIGMALSKVASFVSLNGFINTGFYLSNASKSYFELSEGNLLVTAQISEKLSTEFNFELRENGESFEAEYMFTDYRFSDKLILRAGKFPMPTGEYNEYLEIPYLHKLISAPLTTTVSSAEWTDLGVQLRGKFAGSSFSPYYALAVTNGLQSLPGGDEDEEGEEEEEGGGLVDNNYNKAVTAQLGIEYFEDFNTSVSYHTSKYDEEEELSANVVGVSFSYDNKKLAFIGEYQTSFLDLEEEGETEAEEGEIESGSANSFYALTAYRINSFEPVIRFDWAQLDTEEEEEMLRLTFGLNYHFNQTGVIKVNYELIQLEEEDDFEDFLGVSCVLTF